MVPLTVVGEDRGPGSKSLSCQLEQLPCIVSVRITEPIGLNPSLTPHGK